MAVDTTTLGYHRPGINRNLDVMGERGGVGPNSRQDYLKLFELLDRAKADITPDPVFGVPNQRSVFDSVVKGNTVFNTALSKMYPGQNFSPKATVAAANNRDATQKHANIGNPTRTIQGGQAVLAKQRGQVLKQAEQGHRIAEHALMETAQDMGLDAGAVRNTMLYKADIGKGHAAAVVGTDLVMAGAGSVVTAGMAGKELYAAIVDHKKMAALTPEVRGKLLAATLEKLQSPPAQAQADSRAQQGVAVAAAESLVGPDGGSDFSQFTVDDLREFLATPPDQQSEIVAIDAEIARFEEQRNDLKGVQHALGIENPDQDKPRFGPGAQAAQDEDAGNVALAGDSLASHFGIKVGAGAFNAKDTAPALAAEFDVKAFMAANNPSAPRVSA